MSIAQQTPQSIDADDGWLVWFHDNPYQINPGCYSIVRDGCGCLGIWVFIVTTVVVSALLLLLLLEYWH